MRRLFWVTLGAGLGVAATRRVTRATQQLTPAGVAQTLQNSAVGAMAAAREFVQDARTGAADRDAELRAGTGIDGKLGAKPEDFARP